MLPDIKTLTPALERLPLEPFYQPVGDEVALFEAAARQRLPVLLKGPTGCGKTRFVEYMAWRLKKPLITVACNEDMTASDLVGRFLLDAQGTRWQDGPLALAASYGLRPADGSLPTVSPFVEAATHGSIGDIDPTTAVALPSSAGDVQRILSWAASAVR